MNPRIFLTQDVNARVAALTRECPYEINGIGRVTMHGSDFVVDEVAVLKQEVSGAHAEMDTDDLAAFLAARDDGDQWRLQWHSHVNMGTFWSSTDEEAIRTIGQSGTWVLSMVVNKAGDCKTRVDAFNAAPNVPPAVASCFPELAKQLTRHDLPVHVLYPEAQDVGEWAKAEIQQKVSARATVVTGFLPETKKNQGAGGYGGGKRILREAAFEERGQGPLTEEEEQDFWREWERHDQVLEPADRPLSALVDAPYPRMVVVVAEQLGTTVDEVLSDYGETAIRDLFEEYLLTTDDPAFFRGVPDVEFTAEPDPDSQTPNQPER